jgi:hypothetical protein
VAISTAFAINIPRSSQKPRRVFKNADWKRIRSTVAQDMKPLPKVIRDEELDEYASQLVQIVQRALEKHIPLAKPSPYAKRW